METADRRDILPRSLPPRGLARPEAARYVGISPTTFDEMVKDGRMPKPKMIGSKPIWDVRALDLFFDELPDQGTAPDKWGAVSV